MSMGHTDEDSEGIHKPSSVLTYFKYNYYDTEKKFYHHRGVPLTNSEKETPIVNNSETQKNVDVKNDTLDTTVNVKDKVED